MKLDLMYTFCVAMIVLIVVVTALATVNSI